MRADSDAHCRVRSRPRGVLLAALGTVWLSLGGATLPSAAWLAPAACADEGAEGVSTGAERACLDIGEFRGAEYCGSCHPQHYREWRGSAHAYATVDPIFQACNRKAHADTGGKIGGLCVGCHVPAGVRTGVLKSDFTAAELNELPQVVSQGVSCEVCHRMRPPKAGAPIGNASFEMNDSGVLYGRLRNPEATTAHDSEHSAFHGESRLCGSCHDVLHDREALEKSFAEWSASVYNETRRTECQDCHMLRYSGTAATGGPFRETLRRHNFPAVTIPLISFPNRGLQAEAVRQFLRTAARMSVVLPPAATAGESLSMTVLVKNSGSGHNLPSGISTFRQLWLEVTATDAAGNVVFRSGDLDAKGDLKNRHSTLEPDGDPQLVSLSDRFLDEAGKEVLFMWEAARLEEHSLRPLEERSFRYRVPLPATLDGEKIRLRVRLLFRPFAPYGLRALGLPELVEKLPTWEVSRFESALLPVSSKPPRVRDYRVPQDFATLQEALDALEDGDRLRVAPGDYVVASPLDFRGKDVRVQSLAGPARTSLTLSNEATGDALSVVTFRSGETQRATLDGFTTLESALGHGCGGLFTDSAAFIQQAFRDTQHVCFGPIGIGDETAFEDIRRPGPCCDGSGNPAAGAGFCCGKNPALFAEFFTECFNQVRHSAIPSIQFPPESRQRYRPA